VIANLGPNIPRVVDDVIDFVGGSPEAAQKSAGERRSAGSDWAGTGKAGLVRGTGRGPHQSARW